MNEYTQENLERAVQNLFEASKADLTFDEAAEILMRLGEQARPDKPLSLAFVKEARPDLWRYLLTDQESMGEFQIMLDLFNMVAAGKTPTDLKIPAPPDSPSLAETIGATLERLLSFPGFPPVALAPTRGRQLEVGPVQVPLNEMLSLELTPAYGGEDESTRELFLSFLSDEHDEADFEGLTVDLLESDSQTVINQGMVDEMGDAVLSSLSPNTSYDLQLELQGTTYRIGQIMIP